ncbi:hypothetical protein [Pseudomonas anguilliseptica]|uniref:Uncharacterized protein n=1 Tax=Pseudomonas anguilliseptica TaxID=53406 RepID=A0A1H5DB26_PSEAG|nr:hypothetical protein [Pseudomonas anguilliseptica]SED75988.1 hypothetical protein SAMN05421553_3269 [Pseudomonas anguilliseptica]
MVAAVKKGLRKLLELGVEELYHANSVLTSCEFLRQGALLSRGSIEALGMRQTPQYSDALDKRYNIWNDVFVDSVDIHARGSMANRYGPVMFVLDTEKLLNDVSSGQLWLTQCNPTKWAGKSQSARWLADIDDWDDEFDINSFDQMIVFRHMGGHVPLRSALKRIVVDAPEDVEGMGIDLYSYALGSLKHAMHLGPKTCSVVRRECRAGCGCTATYEADLDMAKKMYRPFLSK